MNGQNSLFRSIILAGERPEGSSLSQAFNLPASVMVQVAGKPSLERVIEAIRNSNNAAGGIICGPSLKAVDSNADLKKLLQQPDYKWLEQATGPAASALYALDKLNHYPTLLTAGDHALLTAEIVDDFCQQAASVNLQPLATDTGKPGFDLIIGFVPYQLVQSAWPESKRTVLKFSNGQFCGSNLFAVMTPAGRNALGFWQQSEVDRKKPWRIARRFGILALLLYLFRRLKLEDALGALSKAAGCRIGYVTVGFARAAVDVDSVEDQRLAEKILSLPK